MIPDLTLTRPGDTDESPEEFGAGEAVAGGGS
jgi:hypothetical protein